jgi:hypothetical protein
MIRDRPRPVNNNVCGKSSVMSGEFGNSIGDQQMLEYTGAVRFGIKSKTSFQQD